jgi:hypothetical protein
LSNVELFKKLLFILELVDSVKVARAARDDEYGFVALDLLRSVLSPPTARNSEPVISRFNILKSQKSQGFTAGEEETMTELTCCPHNKLPRRTKF